MKCHQRTIRENNPAPMPLDDFIVGEKVRDVYGYSFGRILFRHAKAFIEKYEWLGYIGRGRIAYGLWKGNLLYGVNVFCPLPLLAVKQLPEWIRPKALYLSRGACCLDAGEHAGSALVGASLRELKKSGYLVVLAYADSAAGERGVIYRASNGVFGGFTSSKGTVYKKYDGKWYSPKSAYNRFGKDQPEPEETKKDQTNKMRFYWILNERKKITPILPPSWAQPNTASSGLLVGGGELPAIVSNSKGSALA
jgi:hypothetical protein